MGSVAAARKNDLDWITKTIDVIVCFVLCFVFIVFGGGYQTNWSKSYESCYISPTELGIVLFGTKSQENVVTNEPRNLLTFGRFEQQGSRIFYILSHCKEQNEVEGTSYKFSTEQYNIPYMKYLPILYRLPQMRPLAERAGTRLTTVLVKAELHTYYTNNATHPIPCALFINTVFIV